MTDRYTQLDQECINAIRFLAVDGVQQANSGHPGAPMGMAPMAYVLWNRFLKHSPANPSWTDRDRFILSAGHASMLLYSLLHLTGYDLSLDDLKQFRQWESKTPGHPEYGMTPGVEVTTGPLGSGFATGVGMALAERALAARFNRPEHSIVDHYTYAIVSDGDLQEGVASEAASLAGTLQLGKLIYLYDDNDISIEGHTDIAFRENVGERFAAYGWQVIGPIDGMNPAAVEDAITAAQAETTRPSIIICQTIIGFGSPAEGTSKVHGEPLGAEGVTAAKTKLGWPTEPAFYVPQAVYTQMQAVEQGKVKEEAWNKRFAAYQAAYPELAAELSTAMAGTLPENWDADLAGLFPSDSKPIATRAASGKVLNALAKRLTTLMGGSADLAPSNKSNIVDGGEFGPDDATGRNLHFGIREHAMGAIANGMALHGGVIPYTATFFTFSDYMRPPLRLAALMGLRVVHIFTHDSIGVGEDGPTHQPVEQLMALRVIPNYTEFRPADATETAEAWRYAITNTDGPTGIMLTRQNLPVLDRAKYAPAASTLKGGYTLWQSTETPDVILIATGSEVSLALSAAEQLAAEGTGVRVVSLPSWAAFDKQSAEYRESVLPSSIRARVAIEAGICMGWERYAGDQGEIIGMQGYGASAPAKLLFEHFGFTVENVVATAKRVLAKTSVHA
ncbi:MAG TPA: transketolase [Armatimonadota bacterium]|nr:transketolase [Armatimonadota bacterium]